MKQQKRRHSFSIDRGAFATHFRARCRVSACAVLFLSALAFCAPDVRASDGCAFFWKGGSGDVGEKNNWTYGDCSPDPSLLPGPMDGVHIGSIDNNGNPVAITVTGDLNVGGAIINGQITMTGTLNAPGGVQAAGGGRFEKR